VKEVLIIENNSAVAEIYSGLLEARGLSVSVARDGEEGLRLLGERRPDGVLLDLGLPKVGGVEIIRHIRRRLGWADVPVFVSTAAPSDLAVREAAKAGATRVLEKTWQPPRQIIEEFLAAVGAQSPPDAPAAKGAAPRPEESSPAASVRECGERRHTARLLALLAEFPFEDGRLDTQGFRAEVARLGASLDACGDDTGSRARVVEECARLCEDFYRRARALLAERGAEHAEALKLLRELAADLDEARRELGESLDASSDRFERLTEIEDFRELRSKLSAEVAELKRIIAERRRREDETQAALNRRIEGLRSRLRHAREEAALDPLTKLYNRGAFDRALAERVEANAGGGAPFALALFDLDEFKRINDTHGHHVGDRVLMTAAAWLSEGFRPTDFVARYGGEEFAVLLEKIETRVALSRITALLGRLSLSRFEFERAGQSFRLAFTASCGLACGRPGESSATILSRADEALYRAKRAGKNRVEAAE
jgi:diguanylate cyclase (GGDEF)-like protein